MDRYAKVTELDTTTYQESQAWRVTITVLPTAVRFGYSGALARDLPSEARNALRTWLDEADAR